MCLLLNKPWPDTGIYLFSNCFSNPVYSGMVSHSSAPPWFADHTIHKPYQWQTPGYTISAHRAHILVALCNYTLLPGSTWCKEHLEVPQEFLSTSKVKSLPYSHTYPVPQSEFNSPTPNPRGLVGTVPTFLFPPLQGVVHT